MVVWGNTIFFDDRRQSAETDCPEERSPLVSDSSASFFNTLQVKRLPEPGFSLRGEDNVQNGQQTQVPFKLSRDYSFEEEGFED